MADGANSVTGLTNANQKFNVGDRIKFELVAYNSLSFQDLNFAFNAAGRLIVSTDLGVLAEIQGLNPNVELEAQIERTNNNDIKLIAEI